MNRLFLTKLSTYNFKVTLPTSSWAKSYSTVKPSIALISKIRQKTEISITKAKQALLATNNDLEKALIWIEEDLVKSGAKKAEKLADRLAGEGLIGIATLNDLNKQVSRGALVELCCETDFVTRNNIFQNLAQSIAESVLTLDVGAKNKGANIHHLTEQEVKQLLLKESSTTVNDAISEAVGKLGENIQLRRVIRSEVTPIPEVNYFTQSFAHGGDSTSGKIGGLITVQVKGNWPELKAEKLSNQLARHVVGLNPACLSESDELAVEKKKDLEANEYQSYASESVLLNQTFLFGSDSVKTVIDKFNTENQVEVTPIALARMVAGEEVEKPQVKDFREEVMKQVEKFN